MGIEDLYKIINSDNNCIKINKSLFSSFEIDEAVFYSYLVSKCYKNYKKENYKYFNDEIYFYSPIEDAEKTLNLTPFKQRNILNKLQKKNLLSVKFGQARSRYVCLNSADTVIEKWNIPEY